MTLGSEFSRRMDARANKSDEYYDAMVDKTNSDRFAQQDYHGKNRKLKEYIESKLTDKPQVEHSATSFAGRKAFSSKNRIFNPYTELSEFY